MSRGPYKITHAQRDAWNAKFKPGAPCRLVLDDGREVETHTRSACWLVCDSHGGGIPLVKVDGYAGGWSLNRLKMLEPVKAL